MSRRRQRNNHKRAAAGRTQPMPNQAPVTYNAAPGGAAAVTPTGVGQGIYNQTFYGSQMYNTPTGQMALFSPGSPLPTQPGVNPLGYPIRFKFPVAYNTFPPDRSMGNPDIPSFEQLRTLAKLYSGIALAERVWSDMVPRMKLKIKLKKHVVDGGGTEDRYKNELTHFRKFFEKPDGKRDVHTWIRIGLKEQTQIDELYIYKHKTRGGRLLGLRIISGDTFKPLLDDWGDIPQNLSKYDPRGRPYAYQQYPWGIPGWAYTADQMVHHQESPSAYSPYGFSRVEGIILLVNIALRKQNKDLARYTDGNVPAGIMEVPPGGWQPDQIDAFEQAWNGLLAGNLSKQVQVRFTQPGFKYTAFEQPEANMHLTEMDQFLFNVSLGMYGVSMQDVAFTESIHKSSDAGQENMLYRRTVDPLAVTYAGIFTRSMEEDFEPDLHGDLFEAEFAGYDETEDLQTMATSYSMVVENGILGLSEASNLMALPTAAGQQYIGRVIKTPQGPVFLDNPELNDLVTQALGKRAAPTPASQPAEPVKQPVGAKK